MTDPGRYRISGRDIFLGARIAYVDRDARRRKHQQTRLSLMGSNSGAGLTLA
jgi:hypothetical protein